MTSAKKVLIAGLGKLGSALGLRLCAQGLTVYGVRRQSHLIPQPIQPICADLSEPASLSSLADTWDIVLYILAAQSFDEKAYRQAYVENLKNLMTAIGSQNIGHLFFVSSSSVYGQDDGAWLDESSPTEPSKFNGIAMLEGEHTALNHNAATVVRFSGIYGDGRTRMFDKACRGLIQTSATPVYSNRIHQEDCVGTLSFLVNCVLAGESLDTIYIASDSCPAPLSEVQTWIASQVGIAQADLSEDSARRFAGSKRLSNQRLRNRGYEFIHPDYKSGYAQLVSAYRKDHKETEQ